MISMVCGFFLVKTDWHSMTDLRLKNLWNKNSVSKSCLEIKIHRVATQFLTKSELSMYSFTIWRKLFTMLIRFWMSYNHIIMSNTLIPTFHGDFQAREINIKKTFWGLEVKLTPSFPPPTHGFGLWRIFF